MRLRTRTISPIAGLVLATGLVLAIAPAVAAAPSHAWTRQFGTAGSDYASASAVDAARNIYIVGTTKGALPGQVSRGEVDIFVRKYRPNGRVVWTRQFGTAGSDYAYAIAIDGAGKIYITGSAADALPGQTFRGYRDAFVRKLRPNGSTIWTRQFGTTESEYGSSIAIDRAGRIYVAGSTGGSLSRQTSKGNYDVFVRKLRSDGSTVWTRQFGTADSDHAYGIAISRSGRIYVTGNTRGAFPGYTSKGNKDVFVRKLRPNGSMVWTRQFGTAERDTTEAVAVDRQGKIYIAGYTSGTLPGQTAKGGSDIFVRKYRPDGSKIWTRQFGTKDADYAYDLTTDASNRVFVAAEVQDDVFVRKFHPGGRTLWSDRVGPGAATTWADGVSLDGLGNIYVVGATDGRLPGQTSKGDRDAFIRKYRR